MRLGKCRSTILDRCNPVSCWAFYLIFSSNAPTCDSYCSDCRLRARAVGNCAFPHGQGMHRKYWRCETSASGGTSPLFALLIGRTYGMHFFVPFKLCAILPGPSHRFSDCKNAKQCVLLGTYALRASNGSGLTFCSQSSMYRPPSLSFAIYIVVQKRIIVVASFIVLPLRRCELIPRRCIVDLDLESK